MRRGTGIAAVVVTAALACGVSGCSGGSSAKSPAPSGGSGSGGSGDGPTGSSPGGSSGTGNQAAKDAITKVMGTDTDLPVIAHGSGKLGDSQVVVEILQVQNSPQATRITWRLKSGTGGSVDTKSFQFARPPLFDTRQLGVVDPGSKKVYRPYTYVPAQGDGSDTACVCSGLPDSVTGKGTVMYAVLPPLPTKLTAVNVTLPGFKALTGVKVTS